MRISHRAFDWIIFLIASFAVLLSAGNLAAQTRPMGTDVSAYQGSSIPWSTVKKDGVYFAWAKAAEGTASDGYEGEDADFTVNEANAHSAGVPLGAYYFARPSADPNITGSRSADSEAQFFWSVASNYVKAGGTNLVPMLDWEDPEVTNVSSLTTTTMSEWLNEWCNDVSNYAYAAGVVLQPVVYTGSWYSEPGTYPGLNSTVTIWPTWVASYPDCTEVNSNLECGDPSPQTDSPSPAYPWNTWNIWQYGDTNWSGGDSDVFNGTTNQFIEQFVVGAYVPASAAMYWDPSGKNASPGSGGTGTWQNANDNWWLSGSADSAWPPNGSDAIFAGTAGTVTLGDQMNAASLTFSTTGYTITGTSENLLLDAYGAINVPSGNSATIACILGGNAFNLTGGGALTLNNGLNWSDGETVTGPNTTLIVTTDHPLGNDNVVLTLTHGGIYEDSDSAAGDEFLLQGCTVSLGSGGGIFSNPNANLTMTNKISGSGSLTITAGSRTLTMTCVSNNYSGGTIVQSGTLLASATGVLGSTSGALTVSGGTLNLNGASHTVGAVSISSGTIQNGTLTGSSYTGSGGTVSAVLAGSGPLTLSSGTMTLSGLNTYTGITTVSNGSLVITNDANLGAAPSSLVANQLTLNSAINNGANDYGVRAQTTSFTLNANRGIYLGTNGGSFNMQNGQTLTIAGPISGPGNFWSCPNSSAGYGTIILNNVNNTYEGATYIGAGYLELGVNSALPSGTPLNIGSSSNGVGATFNMNGKSQTIGPLASSTGFGGAGTGTPTIDLTGALTIQQTNDTTFAGVITSSGGSLTLTVPNGDPSGTLTLTGNNTYTGDTAIIGGTLALSGNGAINSTASLSIAAGATFDVSALSSYTLSGSTTLNASGTASPATIKGSTTVNLGSQPIVLTCDGSDPALTISQGTLVLNGNTFTVNGSTLNGGVYTLIQQTSGNINASGNFSVSGTVIPAADTAFISVNGGSVQLTVLPPNTTPVTITGAAVLANGTLQLNFAGVPYYTYFIEATTNLNPPITWTLLSTNTADVNGLFSYSDTNSTNFSARYYQTIIPQN